jgi:aryl carrier-like protein
MGQELLGPNQFPTLRGMSGLSGSMFGVTADGLPSIRGAMGISTPIGFSLGNLIFDIGGATKSYDDQPVFPNFNERHRNNLSSGNAQLMGGVKTPVGDLTVGGNWLSAGLDSILNLQLQAPIKWDRGGISIGCQNLFNRPEAAFDGSPYERDLSRSEYIVGTYEVTPGAYVTLGKGDVRFKGVFGSACANLTQNTKAVAEYDTFGWNAGLAYSLGRVRWIGGSFQHNETTLFAGFLGGDRCTVGLNLVF